MSLQDWSGSALTLQSVLAASPGQTVTYNCTMVIKALEAAVATGGELLRVAHASFPELLSRSFGLESRKWAFECGNSCNLLPHTIPLISVGYNVQNKSQL